MRNALAIAGGGFLLLGLLCAFWSFRLDARVMGRLKDRDLSDTSWQATREQAEERRRHRQRADALFYTGLVLTTVGVVLQTLSSVLPAPSPAPTAP